MTEKRLVDKIVKALRERGVWVYKTHGGAYTRAGVPDLLLCVDGWFVGMEIKLPGCQPTKRQQYEHDQIQAAGGVAIVITSTDEALATVDRLRDKHAT